MGVGPECTKIAHRRLLAIFTAHEGIAGNTAARTIFTHFLRRNRGFSSQRKSRILGSQKIARFFRERSKSPPQPQRSARFWCTQGGTLGPRLGLLDTVWRVKEAPKQGGGCTNRKIANCNDLKACWDGDLHCRTPTRLQLKGL